MPGLCGILGRGGAGERADLLHTMLGRLTRGPCSTSGTLANPQAGLWIGWVCHRDSFTDCMPIWNESHNVCVFLAGQVFTDRAELDELQAGGHEFDRDTANILVHLYEARGSSFVDALNGQFSGIVLDQRQDRMLLFNDRYGLQRLYYHENSDGFFFSSEAKALLGVLPETRRLDRQALGEWLTCGCVLAERSLFQGIRLLPPGARWEFASGQPATRSVYFEPKAWEGQERLSAEAFAAELQGTFPRILPRYLRSRERVGMSLTGGLDGRLIMAWARTPPGALPCYTFGGTYRDCADIRVARRVAAACQQPHRVLRVGDEFLTSFAQFADAAILASDGTMDVSGAVEVYVNRLAREVAPVRLTGNYGSEVLRGYVAFRPETVHTPIIAGDLLPGAKAAAARYAAERECNPLTFIAFKQVPWHHYARWSVEQSQLTARSPFLDNDLVRLMYRAPKGTTDTPDTCLQLLAAGSPNLARIPTDRGLAIPANRFATRLRDLCYRFTAKAEYAYDYGMPNWLLHLDRCFAALRAERFWLGRHKFYHFRTWYRNQLGPYVREVLLDPVARSRDYLRPGAVERLVRAHLAGTGNHTTEIHQLLSLELVHRHLLQQPEDMPTGTAS